MPAMRIACRTAPPTATPSIAALLALCGCMSLNTSAPANFDLTGDWALDEFASDAPPDLAAIRRREDRNVARGRQSNPSGSAAFVVQDFPVLGAGRLRIEQNADSMGIRYDGAIYRDVSWGERERNFWIVRAGWEEGALVVRSSRGGTKGMEAFVLENGGERLRVRVRVRTEGEDVDAVRIYRRVR